MRSRGATLAFLLLITALTAIATLPRSALASGPEVKAISWYPVVPARAENVIVEANLSSPNGVASASVQWCLIPSLTCQIVTMTDTNGDGRWNTGPIFVVTDHSYTGADFNISATDSLGSSNYSRFYYVQFADAIQVNATLNTTSAAPGGGVSVSGTAYYQYENQTGWHTNYSTPAVNTPVRIEVVETHATTMARTDGSGGFMASFLAPGTEGAYTVNVSVTNRTLTGFLVRHLAVSAAPTPDPAVVPGSLAVSPSSPKAGDNVTISFSVENRGSADAPGFTVRVTIRDSSFVERLRRDLTISSLAPSATATLTTWWTAAEGAMTVNVTIDPAGSLAELSRANNYATAALAVGPTPPNGLSITLIAGLTILIVGAAATAVVVILRRRGARPERPR